MTSRHSASAALAAALALSAAPPANATALSGLARLTPTGPAAASLDRQGVRLVAHGAADSAKTGTTTALLLPAGDATFATTSRLRLSGALVLRRKVGGTTRSVRLSDLQLRLGRTRAVSAKVGGRRMDVFRLDLRKGEYTADAASTVVRIEGTRASLTAPAAAAIGRALALRTRRAGTFGVLAVTASAPAAPSAGNGTGGTSSAGGTPTGAATTQLPAGSGSSSAPAVVPVPLARPASAVDVVSSALRWHVRESFVRYVRSGEGVAAMGGATAGAAAADGVIYDYDFTPAGGWYDPATGRAHLDFRGELRFSYAGHGIDIRFADPQIELDGEQSRVLATFSSAKASGFSGLGEFTSLDLAAAQTAGTGGPLLVRSAMPAAVTPWANEAVMSGFYPSPDDAFGSVDLRFTRAS
jgi:Htaa